MPYAAETNSQQQRAAKKRKYEALKGRPPPQDEKQLAFDMANTPLPRRLKAMAISSAEPKFQKTPVSRRATAYRSPLVNSNEKIIAQEVRTTPLSNDHTEPPADIHDLQPVPRSNSLTALANVISPHNQSTKCHNHSPETSVDEQSAQSDSIGDDVMNTLEIELLQLSDSISRTPSSNSSNDQSEIVPQPKRKRVIIKGKRSIPTPLDISDGKVDADYPPPWTKQRKEEDKPRRKLPVNELVTTSERVSEILSEDEEGSGELQDDPISRDASPEINALKSENRRQKERSRKQRERKERKRMKSEEGTLISIKFPSKKPFDINPRHFQRPAHGVPLNLIANGTVSEGFEAHEKELTGRFMKVKRFGFARYTRLSSVPKIASRMKELTIVAEKLSDYSPPGERRKKHKYPKLQLQDQPVESTPIPNHNAQDSGIATPPTNSASKFRHPAGQLPATVENLQLPTHEYAPSAISLASRAGPATTSPLRYKVERNSQSQSGPYEVRKSTQHKTHLPPPRTKSQRRREERMLASQELSAVIVKRRSYSTSSEEETTDESPEIEEGSISSTIRSSSGVKSDSGERSDGESQEIDKEDLEIESESEKENLNELESVENELGEEKDEDIMEAEEVEEMEGEEEWRPRVPTVVMEIEDDIVSSPAPFRSPNPAFRLPSRAASRIKSQLSIIEEEHNVNQVSQGSTILGEENFQVDRYREIPETQMNPVVEEEFFSQKAWEPSQSYFERASQHIQRTPRQPSLRLAGSAPLNDSLKVPKFVSEPGLKRMGTFRAHASQEGPNKRSLQEITRSTSSHFGTFGSPAKKRRPSVPLLSQRFGK